MAINIAPKSLDTVLKILSDEKVVRERVLRNLILFITGMKRETEMKQYYAERNGLIQGQLSIDLDELLELFKQTYD